MNQTNVKFNTAGRGFSLVELLVSLAISSTLLLGISTMLMSTDQTYDVQLGVSEVVEKGRIAMDNITRHVRMTGYRNSNWGAGPIGNAINATDGTSDTFTVSYESAVDCNRAPAPASGIVTNVFDVTAGVLRCNGLPVIDGIEEMQVFFGEDIDGDLVADRFMWPAAPGLLMNRVVTVNVNIVARSDQANISTGAVNYRLPWWSNDQRNRPDDGRLRREFSTTVAVRNIL